MMILVCIFTYTDDNHLVKFVILRVLESKLIKHIKNKRKIILIKIVIIYL